MPYTVIKWDICGLFLGLMALGSLCMAIATTNMTMGFFIYMSVILMVIMFTPVILPQDILLMLALLCKCYREMKLAIDEEISFYKIKYCEKVKIIQVTII